MKDKQMRALIGDINVLVYIHDVLSINESNSNFINSDTYRQLYERNIVTVARYFRKTVMVVLSFVFTVCIIKLSTRFSDLLYILFFILSVIYGVLIVSCKNDILGLVYQLKAKKAVQFALENYTYQEFVLFLDQYLSEESTNKYFSVHKKRE